MILSELLNLSVIDANGTRIGLVVDARFVIDGTPHQLLADARLHGLIVGRHSKHSFMGYERTGENRPVPIARFLRWRERESFLVLWEDIERINTESVRLRHNYARYSPELAWPPQSSDGA